MLRIALTGGIATGKSVVAAALREAGFATIDADVVARDVVRPHTPTFQAILERFGAVVLAPDGQLDRQALGRIVFADRAARRHLEQLIHPPVRRAIDAFFDDVPEGGVGLAEVPLLYETGWVSTYDVAVVVACRPATQRGRLMARDGLSGIEADRRLAAQWPIADKVRLADGVIVTEGTMSDTLSQVSRLAVWLRGLPRRA